MTEPSMVEKVARTLEPQAWAALETGDTLAYKNRRTSSLRKARAAIEAIPDDDEAFLAALSRRAHDARFGRSGETYPVLRNFIRALKDAALEGKEENLSAGS